MNSALFALDMKKQDMVKFTTAYRNILRHHDLYATGTSGLKIQEASGILIDRFQSGGLGGDQVIGA
ncbi:methylglyoxal synthase, partial [Bacillus vallismortis]|nr:methylglyoxal synthase [Bacillus vallismortis]